VEWVGGAPFIGVAEVPGDWSAGDDDAFAAPFAECGWSTRDRDLTSFSRCFLESICERNAFSVVYTLLMTVTGHFRSAEKEGHPLADFAGGGFRRQHTGGLLPSLEHLLIENCDADWGQ